MPVTFAPAAPFNPYIDAATGFLERSDKDRKFALEKQAQDTSTYSAMQRAQAEGAHQQQQAAQFQQHQIEYLQQPQRQAQALEQQTQATAKLQQMELTQAEKMRMQRIESQMSALDEAGPDGDGYLTQNEVNDHKLKLQTGYDRLKERQQASQQRHQEEQDKLIEQRLLKDNAQQEAIAGLQAKTAKERTSTIYDEQDGHKIIVYRGMDGKEHITHLPPAKTAADQRDLSAKQFHDIYQKKLSELQGEFDKHHREQDQKERPYWAQDRNTMEQEAHDRATREYDRIFGGQGQWSGQQGGGQPGAPQQPATVPSPGPGDFDANDARFKAIIAEEKAKGFDDTNAYLSAKQRFEAEILARKNQSATPPPAGPAQPLPPQARPKVAAEEPRKLVTTWGGSDEDKSLAYGAIDQIRSVQEKYGSLAAAPDDVREGALAAARRLDKILTAAKKRREERMKNARAQGFQH